MILGDTVIVCPPVKDPNKIQQASVEASRSAIETARSVEGARSGVEMDLGAALHEVSNALTIVTGWLLEAKSRTNSAEVLDAIEVAEAHARLGHSVARRAIGAPVVDEDDMRSVVSLLERVVKGLRPQLRSSNLDLQLRTDDADDTLIQNATLAQQVLVNLLLNAIEFSPSGGTISVSLEISDADVLITVCDDGPGVSADRQESIFRGDSSRPGGTGIGLRCSRDLAEQCGAELRLVPSDDSGRNGAAFELRWPASEAPSRLLRHSAGPTPLSGVRVLVLEDDAALSTMLELGLGAKDAEVTVVSTPADFVAALRADHDIALVDLSPLNGSAECRDVEQALIDAQDRFPLVVMSGDSGAAEPPFKPTAWLRKPFELGEAGQLISGLLADHPSDPPATSINP